MKFLITLSPFFTSKGGVEDLALLLFCHVGLYVGKKQMCQMRVGKIIFK